MAQEPYLLFGSTGQVAKAFRELLGSDVVAVPHSELDFLYPELVHDYLLHLPFKPKAIINAVAYTAVDQAELESEHDNVFCINATAPEIIGRFCAKLAIPMLHFSTDYVFDGTGSAPWKVTSEPNPQNIYGASKLLAEIKLQALHTKILIVRTSWVFDSFGKNFLNTMLKLGSEREELKIVSDQVGAPTYAPHLAKASLTILKHLLDHPSSPPHLYGIYHLCNEGEISWFGFAEEIFALGRVHHLPLRIQHLEPIKTSEYPTRAKRPLNSRLDCSKANHYFGVALPHWKQAVAEAIKQKVS